MQSPSRVEATRLDPGADSTIDEVVAAGPALRKALQARGIDTCCGGSLTLGEAAELRGVALEDLLAGLREVSRPRDLRLVETPRRAAPGHVTLTKAFLATALVVTTLGGVSLGFFMLLALHTA